MEEFMKIVLSLILVLTTAFAADDKQCPQIAGEYSFTCNQLEVLDTGSMDFNQVFTTTKNIIVEQEGCGLISLYGFWEKGQRSSDWFVYLNKTREPESFWDIVKIRNLKSNKNSFSAKIIQKTRRHWMIGFKRFKAVTSISITKEGDDVYLSSKTKSNFAGNEGASDCVLSKVH